MRNDVKAGMALALIVVVLAGWYYSDDDTAENTIPLGEPAVQPEAATPTIEPAPRIRRSQTPADSDHRSGSASNDSRNRSRSRQLPTRTPSVPLTATPRAADSQDRSRATIEPVTSNETRRETLEVYTIQPGDTLAMLAELYYGDRGHARTIHDANPQIRNPNAMPVGTQIRIPSIPKGAEVASRLTAQRSSLPQKPTGQEPAVTQDATPTRPATRTPSPLPRTYTVRPGDSFYAIAEEVLGSGTRWRELLEMNRALVKGDPQRLRPGMVLKVPAE